MPQTAWPACYPSKKPDRPQSLHKNPGEWQQKVKKRIWSSLPPADGVGRGRKIQNDRECAVFAIETSSIEWRARDGADWGDRRSPKGRGIPWCIDELFVQGLIIAFSKSRYFSRQGGYRWAGSREEDGLWVGFFRMRDIDTFSFFLECNNEELTRHIGFEKESVGWTKKIKIVYHEKQSKNILIHILAFASIRLTLASHIGIKVKV